MIDRKSAFTLAEILIVLTILGIVATMVISSTVKNVGERQTITKLKKEYAAITNALDIAVIENGPVSSWGWFGRGDLSKGEQANVILQTLVPYLNVVRNCGNTDDSCATSTTYKSLNTSVNWHDGSPNASMFARALLKDGSLIFINTLPTSSTCSDGGHKDTCAYIKIDINGSNPPNRIGVDTFDFLLNSAKITPGGSPDDAFAHNSNQYCNLKSTNNYNGVGCTYLLLNNNNMSYMHK